MNSFPDENPNRRPRRYRNPRLVTQLVALRRKFRGHWDADTDSDLELCRLLEPFLELVVRPDACSQPHFTVIGPEVYVSQTVGDLECNVDLMLPALAEAITAWMPTNSDGPLKVGLEYTTVEYMWSFVLSVEYDKDASRDRCWTIEKQVKSLRDETHRIAKLRLKG